MNAISPAMQNSTQVHTYIWESDESGNSDIHRRSIHEWKVEYGFLYSPKGIYWLPVSRMAFENPRIPNLDFVWQSAERALLGMVLIPNEGEEKKGPPISNFLTVCLSIEGEKSVPCVPEVRIMILGRSVSFVFSRITIFNGQFPSLVPRNTNYYCLSRRPLPLDEPCIRSRMRNSYWTRKMSSLKDD